MRQLRVLALGAAMILCGGLGLTLILAGAGVLSLSSVWGALDSAAGAIPVSIVGAAMLIVAAHYLVQLADERLSRALFHHEGAWGRVDLSPTAIREFIAGVLRTDVGLDRFRIALTHENQGVSITVSTSLSPGLRVTEVGERIQRELAEKVADRTGVEVVGVTVLVRGIRKSEGGS